ncbi:MAG: cytochrome d ubiquinol oxidase subunit II [Acidobacteria bacterium]|nr:cytochrome d ubiquinol oxidase subunit II [Acidobacteriota bacterium]
MPLETIIAGVMVASLVLYALLGGADYGGGVWDLFAFGRRAREQRALIAEAISPVWEANHVWLILVIVILFTAFPPAFAAIATALHIPITLLLIGIVLRGTAFTFRTYDVQRDDVQRRWSLVFSIASIITPILLGTTLGAIASGTIRVENGFVTSGFFSSWLAPFPLAVGFFALALFAFLAAVYLTVEAEQRVRNEGRRRVTVEAEQPVMSEGKPRVMVEADGGELQEDFRLRALVAAVVVGFLALTVFVLAKTGAPTVRAGISRTWWALGLHSFTAIFATGAFGTLWTRRYRVARVCAAAQVTLILLGWAFAQFPHLVEPNITITSAAAPQITLQLLLAALAAGAILLFPSYYYLFRIFKAE